MKKLILMVFILFSVNCFSQKWEEVINNDRQNLFVDFSSIHRTDSTVSMWVKTVYKKEFINYYLEKELKNAERIGYKTKKEDWNGWSYTLVYQTFYKNKNQSSISTIIQYRSSGSIILRYDEKNITRIELAPNSLAWGMYIGFWKTYKIKYRKKVYNLYIDEVETFVEKHPDAEYIG